MLPVSIDTDEPFKFLTDTRQGYYLLFATAEMLSKRGPQAPLWHMECGNQESLEAALRWAEIRRDLWPTWGAMITKKGFKAFRKHLNKLMKKEPIEAVVASVVQKLNDPCQLALGQVLSGSKGVRTEIVYRHSFGSPEARDTFLRWLDGQLDTGAVDELVATGFKSGTARLAEALEGIVSGTNSHDTTEMSGAAKSKVSAA